MHKEGKNRMSKPIKVHADAWLNDCRYCIYSSVCCGIKLGKGKLAEKGCIIINWNAPNREENDRKWEVIRQKLEGLVGSEEGE